MEQDKDRQRYRNSKFFKNLEGRTLGAAIGKETMVGPLRRTDHRRVSTLRRQGRGGLPYIELGLKDYVTERGLFDPLKKASTEGCRSKKWVQNLQNKMGTRASQGGEGAWNASSYKSIEHQDPNS